MTLTLPSKGTYLRDMEVELGPQWEAAVLLDFQVSAPFPCWGKYFPLLAPKLLQPEGLTKFQCDLEMLPAYVLPLIH